jgi:hypothetical protein
MNQVRWNKLKPFRENAHSTTAITRPFTHNSNIAKEETPKQ